MSLNLTLKLNNKRNATVTQFISITSRFYSNKDFDITESEIMDVRRRIMNNENLKASESRAFKVLICNKELFILNCFLGHYGKIDFSSYKEYTNMMQRSRRIQKLHRHWVQQFAATQQMPTYVIDNESLHQSWNADFSKVYETFKKDLKIITDAKARIMEDYRTKLKAEITKEQTLLKDFVTNNPMLAINKLTVELLPDRYVIANKGKGEDQLDIGLTKALNEFKVELSHLVLSKQLTSEALYDLLLGNKFWEEIEENLSK